LKKLLENEAIIYNELNRVADPVNLGSRRIMKKLLFLVLMFTSILALSCKNDGKANGNVLQISKLVSLGDSLTAGVQSDGLVIDFQENSFPSLIAQQLGIDDFQQPLIDRPGISSDITKAPLRFEGGMILKDDLDFDIISLFINLDLPRPYDNLGLPTADLMDAISSSEIFFAFILRGMGTQLEQAISLEPQLITFWLGSNDVLGSATRGGDLDSITPTDDFESDYRFSLTELVNGTSALIVTANIANVTDIPFVNFFDEVFRAIPALGIDDPVPVVFDETFEPTEFDDGVFIPLLTEEGEVVQLLLPALDLYREEGLGIPDESALMDLGFSMDEAADLVSQLEAAGLNPSGIPINGGLTLTNFERNSIQDAVDDFNSVISEVASEFGIPVVDINSALSTLNDLGIDGFSGRFVLADTENTAFSLDGVHPNNGGYAIIANEFIQVINESFGFRIPLLDTDQFRGQYVN
jgi:lysophospholipase L1-like esterase